jgi:hypothetical protein
VPGASSRWTRGAALCRQFDGHRDDDDPLLTNAAIASRLVVSDKTVRNHVSNIFAKLHVSDRAQAVARARDAGLGSSSV